MASFNLKFRWFFYPITAISLIYYGFTLYFLSVPTTLNQARDWVTANLNQPGVVIHNQIRDLELPKNKSSYLLTQDYYCSSKCQAIIEYDLNQDFKPVIIDKYTRPDAVVADGAIQYEITDEPSADISRQLVADFGNHLSSGDFNLDGRMANYFDFDFFRIKNFGQDVYVWQKFDNSVNK